MILSSGKNDFSGAFDFFKWSAPFYETPFEVIEALKRIDYKGKTLHGLYTIGFAREIGQADNFLLYRRITDAGITLGDSCWDTYPNLKAVRVLWQVELCEPIQFVFDDGSTLELLPIGKGGARIGVNSIPAGLENGLNQSNFRASVFFSEVIGKQLNDIELRVTNTSTQCFCESALKPYTETRIAYCFSLSFSSLHKMELVQTYESWYAVKLEANSCNETGIPYSRVVDARIDSDEICIVNGREGGGTIWIVPCKHHDTGSEPAPFFDSYGISIDEDDAYAFLHVFLNKYFNTEIQKCDEENDALDDEYTDFDDEYNGFDWYGMNLYSFDSMKQMLSDIRLVAELLRQDYSDPQLADVVSGFQDRRQWDNTLTGDELEKLRREYAAIAANFYERFCARIEQMMALPGYDTISFAGP